MKIGVKYCGGCNPHYERGELVRRLSEAVGLPITPAREAEEWDVLLVLGGCTNCCADHSEHTAKYGKVCVKSADEYDDALMFLKSAIGKKV